MEYFKTGLTEPVIVDGIYTIHYFEYAKDFAYEGERHDFWEFVYADKRRVFITTDTQQLVLGVGQLYLHRPNEFHTICCDGEHAANAVILSFDCRCPLLHSIAGRVIDCGAEERRLIASVLQEAGGAFSTPLGMPFIAVMEKAEDGVFGGEQMIKLLLEQLIIRLIRGDERPPTLKSDHGRQLQQICAYLEEQVYSRVRFEDIMRRFNLSASVIKKLFREQMNCGAMEYYMRLKMDAAKQMIREENYNFTEIADRLAFNNSQYFTTVFRRVTGMTPTDYSLSVRSNIEGGNKYAG